MCMVRFSDGHDFMSMEQFRTYFYACGALEVQQARLDGIFSTHDTNSDKQLTLKGDCICICVLARTVSAGFFSFTLHASACLLPC